MDRYDEVGQATWYGEEMRGARTASGAKFDPDGFTAAHRTLPLGSYVEVTSLDTGRTILAQIIDRGPSDRGLLIDLSKRAAQALGMKGRQVVRVRRASPTPDDFAAIRAGQPGAPRLDTPPILLAGLRQRLVAGPASATAPRIPAPNVSELARPVVTGGAPSSGNSLAAMPSASPVTQPGYYVQVAAFSHRQRANALARSMGGTVQPTGSLWRVRLGPYATDKQAAQARDGAARRGYGGARVVRDD